MTQESKVIDVKVIATSDTQFRLLALRDDGTLWICDKRLIHETDQSARPVVWMQLNVP